MRVDDVKDLMRGDNPCVASRAAIVKTSPPGRGSRTFLVAEPT